MNPYNLDPRNMTAEERERAAYLAGDYATVEMVAELADVQIDCDAEIDRRYDAENEVIELHAKIKKMQVEIESLRAAAGMIDE